MNLSRYQLSHDEDIYCFVAAEGKAAETCTVSEYLREKAKEYAATAFDGPAMEDEVFEEGEFARRPSCTFFCFTSLLSCKDNLLFCAIQ